jgi:hypothetical protein
LVAGDDGEALLRIADQLRPEMPPALAREVAEIEARLNGEDLMAGVFGAEDEALARGLRRALVRFAAPLALDADDAQWRRMRVAIDGAEMAARGELLSGNAWHLPRLLPSFVFMVALPVVEQGVALELSRRAAELVDRELGPRGET